MNICPYCGYLTKSTQTFYHLRCYSQFLRDNPDAARNHKKRRCRDCGGLCGNSNLRCKKCSSLIKVKKIIEERINITKRELENLKKLKSPPDISLLQDIQKLLNSQNIQHRDSRSEKVIEKVVNSPKKKR